MSVYFSAQIVIQDIREYEKYLEECDRIFSQYNGRYLAVDPAPEILEGNWDYTRSVLIEFPNEEDFKNWYGSEEYQRILKHRLAGARCDSILIHGLKD